MQSDTNNKSIWKNRIFKYSLIGIVIVVLLIVFYNIGAQDQNNNESFTSNERTTTQAATSVSTTNSTNGSVQNNVKTVNNVAKSLKNFSVGYCKAVIPEDWTGVANSQGTGIDLYNNSKTEGAGWFIAPMLTAVYGEPDTAIPLLMSQLGNSNYVFTSDSKDAGYGFVMRDFTMNTADGKSIKGTTLYKKYPVDSTGYVLSYYAGMTTTDIWDQSGASALSAAISIRCTAQYTPSSNDGFSSSTSVSDTRDKESVSDSWSEQAILGYENVYSPSTGEHYQVPTTSYSDTGLQGQDPGYYRTVDSNGTVERLETGYGDY